jgi:peptidoglycan hydrolase CwlO-like protein
MMSRVSEWIDREICLLESQIREANERIRKSQSDINAMNCEIAEFEEDLSRVRKVKEAVTKIEMEENG